MVLCYFVLMAVSVLFYLMYEQIIFSSVKVTERPSPVKELLTRLQYVLVVKGLSVKVISNFGFKDRIFVLMVSS